MRTVNSVVAERGRRPGARRRASRAPRTRTGQPRADGRAELDVLGPDAEHQLAAARRRRRQRQQLRRRP